MRGAAAAALAAAGILLGAAGPGGVAEGHHLGIYVPKDDEVTASFKRMKVFLEQRRPDLLRKEFAEDAWVQRRMAAVDARYHAALVADMDRALAAASLPDAERTLVRFFCFVARENAQSALDRLGRTDLSREQRADQGVKLLAAAWRYYNLVDFRVGNVDARIAAAAKVAFEDAEAYLGKGGQGLRAFDEAKAREAVGRFRDLMTAFLETTGGARAEARRP